MTKSSTMKRLGAGLLFTGFVLSASGSAALAASCIASPTKLTDADISAVVTEPASLLSEFPAGGLDLTAEVRLLVATSPDTVDPILSVLAGASSKQKSAIGAGFARAVKICDTKNPTYATLLRKKIDAAKSDELSIAFNATLSEVSLASLSASQVTVGGLAATSTDGAVTANATVGKTSTVTGASAASVTNGATNGLNTGATFTTGTSASNSTATTVDVADAASNGDFSSGTDVDFSSAYGGTDDGGPVSPYQ